MADKAVFVSQTLTSAAAAVSGEPIYVGGNLALVQTLVVGGTLAAIQQSNDKSNWVDHTTTLGNAVTAVATRPLWIRPQVAIDGSAPRENHFGVVIWKEV